MSRSPELFKMPEFLWIGIPKFLADINIAKAMSFQGMKSDVKVFFSGHSLGGAVLQDYVI